MKKTLFRLLKIGIQKGIVWIIAGLVIEIGWEIRKAIVRKHDEIKWKERLKKKRRHVYGRTGREGFDNWQSASENRRKFAGQIATTRPRFRQSDTDESN